MFYDKEVDILTFSEGQTIGGIFIAGDENTLKTISCDIQPYSSDMLYRDYGYTEQITKRVFCDIDSDISNGTYIRYQGIRYMVKQIIPWDNYMELMINAE